VFAVLTVCSMLVWFTGGMFLSYRRPRIGWPLWITGVTAQSVVGVVAFGVLTLVWLPFPVIQVAVLWRQLRREKRFARWAADRDRRFKSLMEDQ
jgi:hypothetical protein